HPRSTITHEQALQVKSMLIDGCLPFEIEQKTNINRNIIQNIKTCRTWSHILPEFNEKLKNNTNVPLDNSQIMEIKIKLLKANNSSRVANSKNTYGLSRSAIYEIKNCNLHGGVIPEINEKLKKKKYMNSTKTDLDTVNKIIELKKEGYNNSQIANKLNMSRQT